MLTRFVVPLVLTFCVSDAVCRAAETLPTWYVSPQGRDTWSGRLKSPDAQGTDGPLATLGRAVAATREAGPKPRRIVVLPGEHVVAKTIELTDADRGLTFEGAGEQRPVIHGGRALMKWRRENGKLWTVDVPEAKQGTWDFRVLVVDGRIAKRARLPEDNRAAIAPMLKWIQDKGNRATTLDR